MEIQASAVLGRSSRSELRLHRGGIERPQQPRVRFPRIGYARYPTPVDGHVLSKVARQLAGDGFNFDEQFWGERPGDAPDVAALPGLGVVARRTSFATGSPLRVERSDFVRFHRSKDPLPPGGSSSRAPLENTVTYISGLYAEVPVSLETSIVFHTGFSWTSLALPFQYETAVQRFATVNTLVYL